MLTTSLPKAGSASWTLREHLLFWARSEAGYLLLEERQHSLGWKGRKWPADECHAASGRASPGAELHARGGSFPLCHRLSQGCSVAPLHQDLLVLWIRKTLGFELSQRWNSDDFERSHQAWACVPLTCWALCAGRLLRPKGQGLAGMLFLFQHYCYPPEGIFYYYYYLIFNLFHGGVLS